jgi:hypothetical protein
LMMACSNGSWLIMSPVWMCILGTVYLYWYINIGYIEYINICYIYIYVMILCNDQIGLLCISGIDSIDSTILNKDHMIVEWTYTMGLSWNGEEPTWLKTLVVPMGLHNTKPLDFVVPNGLKKRSINMMIQYSHRIDCNW